MPLPQFSAIPGVEGRTSTKPVARITFPVVKYLGEAEESEVVDVTMKNDRTGSNGLTSGVISVTVPLIVETVEEWDICWRALCLK